VLRVALSSEMIFTSFTFDNLSAVPEL